jgi:pyruvate dehydrogenase E1 component
MVALVGDAEFDEGNIFEAMLEGWKHDVRNLWWIIDYNRQSLDSVVSDRLFQRIIGVFDSLGWRVITLKYGKLLEKAFAGPDGERLRAWIDDCPNTLYSALTYKAGWRARLEADLGAFAGIRAILDSHDDAQLHALMTNLAGHDMEAVLEGFREAEASDLPTCFIAYTIKGFGLPFAGHKDNHAGLMSPEQVDALRAQHAVPRGAEWERLAGMEIPEAEVERFLAAVPFAQSFPRRRDAQSVPVPDELPVPQAATMSTQEGFGRVLYELAGGDSHLASRIVTTSPDVSVSTNLGGWVNRRGIFDRRDMKDIFKEEKIVSAQLWQMGHAGQHVELGIAEHNLFLMLGALGLSADLFGARLLPIGTVYDPFIARGLDALNYACYQDARFMVVATPSGLTLAPEGGAHQSVVQPLIGMGQPGLTYFEPAHVDELVEIMRWSFRHMQAEEGGSVYLRLSTRPLAQPRRSLDAATRAAVVDGGYWLDAPSADAPLALVVAGALVPEARAALEQLREDLPGAGLLVATSPDRLHAGWRHEGPASHVAGLLGALPGDARLVTLVDGHPATLSWLGAVRGQLVETLGCEGFGQSGDLPDIYRTYGLDADAIVAAAARALLR